MDPTHSPDDDWVPLPWTTLLFRLVIGIVALGGVLAAVGWLARGPLTAWSAWLVADLGYRGLFLGVILFDSTPFTTHDPLLLAALFSGYPLLPLGLTVSAGAFVAAWVNWLGGRWLGRRSPRLTALLVRYKIPSFLRYYGAWAMVVAGVIPMPFAIAAWGAGAAGVPPASLLAGAVARSIKVVIATALLQWSWRLTA